jgi:hypothetical protein
VSALLLLLAAIAGGTLATWLFDDEASVGWRLAMGTPLGITALGLVGYVLGWMFGLSAPTAIVSALVVAVGPLLFLSLRGRRGVVADDLRRTRTEAAVALRRPSRATVAAVAFYVIGGFAVYRLLDRAMFEAPEGGGVFTGVDHNLGDLPFHIAIATSFVYGGNFPPEHPELALTRLTYPFVVDLVLAMLMAVGASVRQGILLENLALGWSLLALLHRFALRLTRDRLAALIAPVLVFASGGLGFLNLADDVDPAHGGLVALLARPTHDYTIQPQGPLRWGNLVITMLIPQRSVLLGIPLFLVAATMWWQAVTDEDRPRARRRLLVAGAITGLMPLAHAHAFTVAMAVGVSLALLFPDARGWTRALGLAAVLAAPQLLLLATGSSMQSGRFVGWQTGWDHGDQGVLAFWWRNLGLFLPALLVALVWRGRRAVVPRTLLVFYVPFAFCFLVPNLLRLSPWIWDNIKFMVWWHVASALLVALLLARLWRMGGGWRGAAAALLVLLTLSGALDLWRAGAGKIVLSVVPPEGTLFADDVRAATPPRAIVLHAPTYNSEVYLTGRRTLVGYLGHMWSQGLDAGHRQEDLQAIYSGRGPARTLLDRYGVDFVVAGPLEEAMEGFDPGALQGLPLVAERGPYRLYRAR